MAQDLTVAIRLRADRGGFSGELRLAGEELRRLGGGGEAAGRGLGAAEAAGRRLRGRALELRRAIVDTSSATERFTASFRNAASSVAVMHGPLGGIASRLSATATIVSRAGLAYGGLAIGIGGAAFAAQRSVRAWAEAERQLLTTEQIIRATGGAAGQTAADIERMSQRIGMQTLASTSMVRLAGQQLLTFRAVGQEAFERTLEAAQDLAAAGFGDVTSATLQLAKAIEDPVQGLTLLRRAGISFTAAQRQVIQSLHETGRSAEVADAILSQVEQQVGGAAVAAAQGLSGAWDSLGEATGRLMERWGRQIAEGLRLTEVLGGLAEIVDEINQSAAPSFERRMQAAQRDLRLARSEAEGATTAYEGLRRAMAEGFPGVDPQLLAGLASPGQVRATGRAQGDLNDAWQRYLGLLEEGRREFRRLESAAAAAAAAQDEMARDRFETEMLSLQQQGERLRLTELQRQQEDALRRAGVDPAREPARAQAIREAVAANLEWVESERARAEAEREGAAAAARAGAEELARRRRIEESIESLRGEAEIQRQVTALVVEGNAPIEEAERLREALNLATSLGVDLASEEGQEIQRLIALRDAHAAELARELELRDEIAAARERERQEAERAAEEELRRQRTVLDGARAGFEDYAAAATDAFEGGRRAAQSAASSMEDAVAGFATTGKLQVREMVNAMIADFARLAVRQAITGPLFGVLGSVLPLSPAAGGVTSAAVLHAGGLVGQSAPRRRVPAASFAVAPRYHLGGLAGFRPDERPAILRLREEVLTPEDPRHRDNLGRAATAMPASVTINVHAPGGDPRQIRQSIGQAAARLARVVDQGRRHQ